MDLDDVVDFCRLKDCEVRLGGPETGYVRVDGSGLKMPNNYRRYLSHHELASLPPPKEVLASASSFEIRRGEESRHLIRQEFERELKAFRRKAGIE